MPSVLEEQSLRFTFGNSWTVVKYDDHPDYRNRIQKLQESKAADFAAIRQREGLFLIEVKDLRGHRIENKDRIGSGDLAVEVALKVRDTLPGIIGAARTGGDPNTWLPFARACVNRAKAIRVLFWFEHDLFKRREGKALASVILAGVKKNLAWLTPRVALANLTFGQAPADLTVANVPP